MHIDVDPSEIGKIVTAHVPVVGDAKLALTALCEAYAKLDADATRLAEWWHRIRGWQAAHPLREPEPAADGCVAPELALDTLAAALGDAIVTTDVGQHQMWAAGRLGFQEPRRWITSRRARDDGLRPARRARRAGRALRTRPSSASPARARS